MCCILVNVNDINILILLDLIIDLFILININQVNILILLDLIIDLFILIHINSVKILIDRWSAQDCVEGISFSIFERFDYPVDALSATANKKKYLFRSAGPPGGEGRRRGGFV